MENRFTLTRADVARLHKVLNYNVMKTGDLAFKTLGLYVLVWVLIFMAGHSLWDVGKHSPFGLATLLPTAAYGVMAALLYWAGMVYLKGRYAAAGTGERGWLLQEQVLTATDDGVMLQAGFGSVQLRWTGLTSVLEDSGHYYLLIEPCQGFMVPKEVVIDASLRIKLAAIASQALQ
jgi:hypothetical protein